MYLGMDIFPGNSRKRCTFPGVQYRPFITIVYVIPNPDKGCVIVVIYHVVIGGILPGRYGYYQNDNNKGKSQRITNPPGKPGHRYCVRQLEILNRHQPGASNNAEYKERKNNTT
ncbi:hypothetical protein ES703_111285 [subsurface metagenome]